MLFSVSLHVALLVGLSQTLSTTSPAPSTRHFQGATSMQVMLLNPPTTPFVPSSVITGTRLQKAVGVLSPKFTVLPDAATTMDANTTAEPAAPMTSLNLPNEKLSGTAPAQHRTSATESSALPPPEQSARPDYAYNPAPEYPMLLREHGVGGTVWLRVWVDSEGHPANVKVAKGSGYRLFDEAALRVVANWRFIPAQAGEQKLASWVEFPVRFTLNG